MKIDPVTGLRLYEPLRDAAGRAFAKGDHVEAVERTSKRDDWIYGTVTDVDDETLTIEIDVALCVRMAIERIQGDLEELRRVRELVRRPARAVRIYSASGARWRVAERPNAPRDVPEGEPR